jgi:hypothetical protein
MPFTDRPHKYIAKQLRGYECEPGWALETEETMTHQDDRVEVRRPDKGNRRQPRGLVPRPPGFHGNPLRASSQTLARSAGAQMETICNVLGYCPATANERARRDDSLCQHLQARANEKIFITTPRATTRKPGPDPFLNGEPCSAHRCTGWHHTGVGDKATRQTDHGKAVDSTGRRRATLSGNQTANQSRPGHAALKDGNGLHQDMYFNCGVQFSCF